MTMRTAVCELSHFEIRLNSLGKATPRKQTVSTKAFISVELNFHGFVHRQRIWRFIVRSANAN